MIVSTALLLAGCRRGAPEIAGHEPPDKPGEALEYYLRKRLPPGTRELPMERYERAKERVLRMPLYSSRLRAFVPATKGGKERELSLGRWTPLGPGNIGGRIRALLIHPDNANILYTGGVAGGIWKSTDAGASWVPLGDLLPNLAISTMAMDPFNPETLYAGTGEGFSNVDAVRGAGIFKSTDAGEHWTWIESTRNSNFYFVNRIAISRGDTKRVYAATSNGVYRSMDGGDTWERTLDRRSPGIGCQDLAIRTDTKDDVLFASCRGTPQAGIWRNTGAHAGGVWEEVFTAPFMNRTSLALAPSREDVIYALAASSETGTCPTNPGANPATPCYNNGVLGVFRSMQNGAAGSWEARARNSDDNKINATLLSNPQLFFRDVCGNGSKSFSSQGWYDNTIAVDPLDHDIVWAGGIDLFRSHDGGANWGIASYWWSSGAAQYAHADHHFLVFHPRYDGVGNQTLFATGDGGIFRTDNARSDAAMGDRAACSAANSSIHWKSLNNGLGVTQFYHGSAYPGGHFYLAGAQDNGTTLGTDAEGANQWRLVRGGDGGFTAVNPKDSRILFAETTRLSLSRSINGGRTFSNATSGITEASANFAFIAPFAMDPNEPDRLWMGGRTVWRTNDAGRSWTQAGKALTTSFTITALAVSPADPNRVLVATSEGRIYANAQALAAGPDTEWPSTLPRRGTVSWIAFDPLLAGVAYATYSSFGAAGGDRHIYKTQDLGVTWKAIDGAGDDAIPDIPVHSILPDPANPGTLYVGTDIGIFVTFDGGAAWYREDSGFPFTVVESMSIQKSGSGSWMHAFTHGRGAWKVWLGPGEPCRYSLSSEKLRADSVGELLTVQVDTSAGCGWSAISNAGWATIDTAASGIGPGEVRISVSRLPGAARTSYLLIADKLVPIQQ
ncbi:MAG TPA: hypothetical protein VM120_27145 [Bryobacteraceae bacterium]|nr:hypothetical protein [Bryobacteraceae bacterium]